MSFFKNRGKAKELTEFDLKLLSILREALKKSVYEYKVEFTRSEIIFKVNRD